MRKTKGASFFAAVRCRSLTAGAVGANVYVDEKVDSAPVSGTTVCPCYSSLASRERGGHGCSISVVAYSPICLAGCGIDSWCILRPESDCPYFCRLCRQHFCSDSCTAMWWSTIHVECSRARRVDCCAGLLHSLLQVDRAGILDPTWYSPDADRGRYRRMDCHSA